jgi:hypothetical protein
MVDDRVVETARSLLREAEEALAALSTMAEPFVSPDLSLDEVTQSDAIEIDAEGIDHGPILAELDWQVLSRLDAIRSVGLAGALPLVLDDPFGVLDDDEVAGVLERLSLLAEAVQIIVVTERAAAVAWASQAGPERALVHVA